MHDSLFFFLLIWAISTCRKTLTTTTLSHCQAHLQGGILKHTHTHTHTQAGIYKRDQVPETTSNKKRVWIKTRPVSWNLKLYIDIKTKKWQGKVNPVFSLKSEKWQHSSWLAGSVGVYWVASNTQLLAKLSHTRVKQKPPLSSQCRYANFHRKQAILSVSFSSLAHAHPQNTHTAAKEGFFFFLSLLTKNGRMDRSWIYSLLSNNMRIELVRKIGLPFAAPHLSQLSSSSSSTPLIKQAQSLLTVWDRLRARLIHLIKYQ